MENIINQATGRGFSALPFRDLQELALLYRQVAADLATVREDPASARLAEYLNQLLGRAHNMIYMGERRSRGGIRDFYERVFPETFRSTIDYTALSAALFVAGALIGFLACLGDPSFQRYFLGPRMTETIDQRKMWTQSVLAMKPLAASGIMTNNLTVAFSTFALGITGGLGTIYMLMFNGLLMGVISAACWQAGMSGKLWSFVAPHGVLELPSVMIAGAAGLMLGRGLLFPGNLARRDSLVLYGGKASRLILGIIPLLVIAGTTEAFISPSPMIPAAAKFALASAFAMLLTIYLSRSGRQAPLKDFLPTARAGRFESQGVSEAKDSR